MLEHGPALQHQDCPDYLHKQVTQLHDCTWFVLAGDTEVVKTERGTRPGDGFTDTIWSLVFAKWIHRMEERLRATGAFPPLMWNNEVGLNTAIGEHAVPYSLVAWADDVVLLGLDEDPEQLLDKLKFSCQTMVEELTSYGLIPNFNGGKTEAVVDPRGHGSTQIRRRIFTAGKGILELDTPLPDQPHLRLVPKYKHLGGLITHGAKMRPEVAARSAQALQAFTTYRTKLFTEILMWIFPQNSWCCRQQLWRHYTTDPEHGQDLRHKSWNCGRRLTSRSTDVCYRGPMLSKGSATWQMMRSW